MIGKKNIYDADEEKATEYWMSFSDMMASLLLVFILFLTMTMYQVSLQEELLSDKEDEVNKIIGVRKMIVEELKEEFRDSELQIDIDPETGAITFSEGVFFDYDEYKLKDTGKKYLKQFIPQYIKVLLNNKNKQYISEIIIEGHTDKTGSYMYNLELSQKRAFDVAKYVLSDEFNEISSEEKEKLRSILTANGRSFSYIVVDKDGKIDEEKSRRVEFKFRLRDEEMIYKMEEILGDENVD